MFLLKLCLIFNSFYMSKASVPRPRGVSITMASFYAGQSENFSCLDNSLVVPFNYVNDDYCDCPDGSDEPGTAACINGKFHCTNAGYIPNYIPSSRVNDGFCDCCDGTDEYSEIISCPNKCIELGKKAMEERMKVHKMQMEGFAKKQEFINEGKKAKEEKKSKLIELEALKIAAEQHKTEMEAEKNSAEGPEKLAKDTHEKAWEEEKKSLQKEKEITIAKEAFTELDSDSNQFVSVDELKSHSEFDIDSDGTVSDDEAKEYMEEATEASYDHFIEKMWPNIKEIYRKPKKLEDEVSQQEEETTTSPPVQVTPSPPLEPPQDDDDGADEDSDEDADEDDETTPEEGVDGHVQPLPTGDEAKKKTEEGKDKETQPQMPDYDQATKALIEAADQARSKYQDADKKVRELEKDISDVKKILDLDLGPDNEFYSLYSKCFEYTDREYTYSFCPFDRASQRSKSGGIETSLGHWGHWDGVAPDIYKSQKYDKGQNCWNGPDRSVKVHFDCGIDSELRGASEPSRCEYAFSFVTPASCAKPAPSPTTNRDEL
ncbi:glucosidase 2 subunit beta isoform X2 [Octopus bimaculoides]|uniref:Glucosidase 2 subunit beta n=1 Tax=Octopus bimaculoides TaxID=37653 RepID=A0A0L8FUT1_OCTBM|nr:glucosidase 2 subunit beta isoform X2 [Octopus bimaculoides]|eukprot:XP_014786940.1 PREDICTED: glucosidase 2 subunit beta-like isoform X2 [Octopus bimaculoides]